jgi:hypothetical protein
MSSKFHSNRLDQWGSFPLNRQNRRKSNNARHTQVIDVPLYIKKKGLSKEDDKMANLILAVGYPETRSNLFVLNQNKFAGKKKFIFHARPNV